MRRLLVAAIAPVLLVLSCSPNRLPASAIHTIPLGPAGNGPGTISDVLASSSDGTMQVAWRNFDDATVRNDNWFSSWDGERASEPKLLPADGWVTQLVAADDAAHLFTLKFRISHQVARPPSGPWFEQEAIGREGEHVQCLDAIVNGMETVVAYISSPSGAEAGINPSMKLVIAETREGVSPAYHEVLSVPRLASWSTGVRLAKWRDEIHLVCDVSTDAGIRIIHSFRTAGSSDWSSPEDVPAPAGGGLKGIALAATRDRLFLFFGNDALQASESSDGRRWSAVKQLGGIDLVGAGYRLGRNLDASAGADAVVVAWMQTASIEPGRTLGNVLAIASTAVPPTLENLEKSPRIHVTPSARALAGVVATTNGTTHQLVWASGSSGTNDREVAVARIGPPR